MGRMIRFWITWLLLATAAVLFLLNWQCWRPGVGGAMGGRPPGTHMERSFGWPATYQAEIWRSDDQELASRILASAPFYYPGAEMSLEQRMLGWTALAVDVAFALLVLLSVAVFVQCVRRRVWGRRQVALLAGTALVLVGLWAASRFVSVSL
jgi:hypothetical protein